MQLPCGPFDDQYGDTDLIFGRGRIEELGDYLLEQKRDQVLVVCGSSAGGNAALMRPIESAVGNQLAGVFDETTAAKRLTTASNGANLVNDEGIDTIVAVGGGSSLDIGRAMSVLARDKRTQAELELEAQSGDKPDPLEAGGEPVSLITVPTTFAGADLSFGGSLVISGIDEQPKGTVSRVRIGDRRAMPDQIYYDPELFETTPEGPLIGSAMNGFDKGIETIYGRGASPLTDAEAVRGLQFFKQGLSGLGDDEHAIDRAVIGALLVQVDRQTNLIHAVGHGFSRRYPVHQGVIHAIMAPRVLEHLFERVRARREVLAQALGIDSAGLTDQEVAGAIVETVETLRDGLGLPARLSEVEALTDIDFRAVAEFIHQDGPMERTPPEYDPSVEEIEHLLRDAW